jgi:alpha-glucosidase
LSKHFDRGRDGCRVPLPWRSDSEGAYGFSTNLSLTPNEAWLPQSSQWGSFAVNLQEKDSESTLNLYRKALAIRRAEPELGDGSLTWQDAGDDVLAFKRSSEFACYVNFGAPIPLPSGSEILVSSSPVIGNVLPGDTAVWLRLKAK